VTAELRALVAADLMADAPKPACIAGEEKPPQKLKKPRGIRMRRGVYPLTAALKTGAWEITMYKSNMTRPHSLALASVAALAALILTTGTAAAQQPSPFAARSKRPMARCWRKLRDGTMLNVKIADDTRVAALVKATAADIKPDTYIGIAGVPQTDGSVQAFRFTFCRWRREATARASGRGCTAGSTMNMPMRILVVAGDGQTLTVKSKDGEKKIVLTPTTMIAAAAPGNKSELVPGARSSSWLGEAAGCSCWRKKHVCRSRLTPAM